MKAKLTHKNISDMLQALTDSFQEEFCRNHEEEIAAEKLVIEKYGIRSECDVIRESIRIKAQILEAAANIKNPCLSIEELINGNYEEFWERYMQDVEGMCCCCDKASYIVKSTIEFMLTGIDIEFSETYDIEKYPQMKDCSGEIAYWCPKTIKTASEAVKIYNEWRYQKKNNQ